MSTQLDDKGVSRLDFLKASGALVLAFSLPVPLQLGTVEAATAQRGAYAPVSPSQLDAWLAVGTDGTVTVYTGKVELGGGVATGLAQIVAEELDVPLSRVNMVMGDTARTPDQGITAGSQTVAGAGPTLRQVAADARYALLQRAAAHLGVPARALVVKDGVVSVKGKSAQSVSYADLLGGQRFATTVPVKESPFRGVVVTGGKGTPKKPAQYTVVGKSLPRIDIPAK